MSEPALKCENNAIFLQNYVQKLFFFSYTYCLRLRDNLRFPDFLQKIIIASTTGHISFFPSLLCSTVWTSHEGLLPAKESLHCGDTNCGNHKNCTAVLTLRL